MLGLIITKTDETLLDRRLLRTNAHLKASDS
jgi:hypothetical protein